MIMSSADTPQDFNAFHIQLTQAMERNDAALTKQLFDNPVFGQRFYEFYVVSAVDADDVGFLDLILSFDCPISSTRPLLSAIMADKIEHFKKLLPYASKPLVDESLISAAILHNNTEMVTLLAPRYETLNNSKALIWAVKVNNQEAFDLVYPLSDVKQCQDYLKEQKFRGDGMRMLKERVQQERLHHKLSKSVQKFDAQTVRTLKNTPKI